ncbi:MAG: hypothetical protein FWC43_06985 [Planctomycetaceae bacterium]|nr:hypothetical protein [Planctomycetaceae bacterium]
MKFQTGAPSQPKVKKISAEEERTIMEQTNKMFAVGLAAEQQDDLQAAEWAYLKCLQYNEKRDSVKYVGPPYHRLAVIAARQGKMEKSEEYFRKALAHSPENVELVCDFAQMLIDVEREREATTILDNALIAFPKNKKLLFFLGYTLAIQDREIEALRRLKGSIGDAAAYHELAQILREKGNSRGADLMDQKGRLAQQERRKSFDKIETFGKLEGGLNQELIDENAMALQTYSSKVPKLGSINRRYSGILDDQSEMKLDTLEQLAQVPKVNPVEVIRKYGRPRFEASNAMFPGLPGSNDASDFVVSMQSAPLPQVSVTVQTSDVETEMVSELEAQAKSSIPSLPAAPAVPPNQRIAVRPDRAIVFPPEMKIPSENDVPADFALLAETGPVGKATTSTAPSQEFPITAMAELVGESPKLAMRDSSVPTKPVEKPLTTDPFSEVPLLLEKDFTPPAMPQLPMPEPTTEKTGEETGKPTPGVSDLTLQEPLSLIDTSNGAPKTASRPARAAIAAPSHSIPEVQQEEPVSTVSALVVETPTISETQIQTPLALPQVEKVELPPKEPKSQTSPPQQPRQRQKIAERSDSIQLPIPQMEMLTKLYGPARESWQTPQRQNEVPVIPPQTMEIPEVPPKKTVQLGIDDQAASDSEDDNRVVAFGSRTVSVKSISPASDIVPKTEKENIMGTAPKKLKMQSESNFNDAWETPKSSRFLSLHSL